jgi:predicted nucleotidyltransferase
MYDIKDIKDFLTSREKINRDLRLKEKEEIISKLKSLKDIWQRYKIKMVYLYGAFTDMSFHEHSDIDIAIEAALEYEEFLAVFSEVNRHFKREVDVRLLNELPFREKIIKEGILIYERKNTHT